MWEKMKNKWKDFFEADETESLEEVKQEEMHRQIESKINTRVSFHYPKERPFRFPIIPDAPVRQQEMPVYERRRQEKKEKKNEVRPRDTQPVKEKAPVRKEESKQPFKLTEVPSPIYGYKPRRKEVSETNLEIPAYERKSHQKLEEKNVWKEENKNTEEKLEKQFPINNSAQEEIKEEKSESVVETEAARMEDQEPLRNAPVSIDKFKEAKQQEQAKKLPEKAVEKESRESNFSLDEKEKEETRQNRNEIQQKSDSASGTQQKRHVPFNVMMTPKDKRNQYIKRKEEEAVRQKPPVSTRNVPPLHLLSDPSEKTTEDQDWIKNQIHLLETTLKHFHVRAKVVNAMSGPSVTRFEIQPEPGVKVSKIKNLSDDIKLNMAARDIRMEAPIPGKHTIGIEIPNPFPQAVGLQEIFDSEPFKEEQSSLTVALGLDIAGQPIVTNLNKMPHGLIAGATGSGKSVCINSILISLLYKASHEDVKFLLIDPKMVELAPYNELPHLVSPVITDVKAATTALKWAVKEMEDRYNRFAQERVRDIERYNEKMKRQQKDKLPYLIIVIDELADLMMAAPQDVEDAICRIAQKARACGIHLLLATQRPSVDVITGLIKANVPTRIAFSVSSQVDSRTIIDTQGAEKLLGKGDMLFIENGARQPVRIQGAFVSDEEIERVTAYMKKTAPPNYLFEQEQLLEQVQAEEEDDELYEEAVEFILSHNGASASLLQRRFKIGYNRAARLIDQMESRGIISEQKGSKPRDVLMTASQLEETYVGE